MSKLFVISIYILLFFSRPLIANPFGHLKTFTLNESYSLMYNPNFTKIINVKRDAEYIEEIIVAETKIDNSNESKVLIEFSPGISGDPIFYIRNSQTSKIIKKLSCDDLIIPGAGVIYTIEKSNRFFAIKNKYTYKSGAIIEVEQPFHYIGYNTKTTQEVQIFSDRTMKNVVAKLPSDYPVIILASNKNDYLIVTNFGLTGWIRMKIGEKSLFENVYFRGD